MKMYKGPIDELQRHYEGTYANQDESSGVVEQFMDYMRSIEAPDVLELGTKQSIKGRSTMHRDFVPHARTYLGTDVQEGADVDFTADVHEISRVVGEEKYDAVISCSSFEHFKYPHLAAHELMKIIRVGGAIFVQTHQTFPVHAYPYDYNRFSTEAMLSLFGEQMGFKSISAYEYRAHIFSKRMPTTNLSDAFLNVVLFGVKQKRTPKEYIYELDS